MKKKLASILLVTAMAVCIVASLSGCGNKQLFDTTYTFETAIIRLPNDTVVEGKVQSWTDFGDGDQLQIKIDGKTYLVHSSDVCLVSK